MEEWTTNNLPVRVSFTVCGMQRQTKRKNGSDTPDPSELRQRMKE
jgi:hypothetical protein